MNNNIKQKNRMILLIIFIIAIMVRITLVGTYPKGIDADEAYGGYEAWSMLKYGHDSWGYTNPVYLETWGSGMSVMYSVIAMPFIAIGGLKTFTFRLPQVLFGVISVVVFYLLLKKFTSEKTAVLGAFLMAISPWHIILSRYGLDANLAPAFILLAAYFGILGLEKKWYLVVSALFWGLSLYCYALMWIFVPLFLLISVIYCYNQNMIKINIATIMSVIVLFVISIPLLLFVAVNSGIIPEIITDFISIPKLIAFRSEEFSIKDIPYNIWVLLRVLIKQDDGTTRNVIPYFGIYYLFSAPVILYGGYIELKKVIISIKNKQFCVDFFVLAWIFASLFIGILKTMSIQRINYLHAAVYVLIAVGLSELGRVWKGKLQKILICLYAISFICFEVNYFTQYQQVIGDAQLAGADEALEYAQKMLDEGYEKINIVCPLRHSQVLFYTQYDTDKFINEVKWQNYAENCKWLSAESFGDYTWGSMEELNPEHVYILKKGDKEQFEKEGYLVKIFDTCAVAVYGH